MSIGGLLIKTICVYSKTVDEIVIERMLELIATMAKDLGSGQSNIGRLQKHIWYLLLLYVAHSVFMYEHATQKSVKI